MRPPELPHDLPDRMIREALRHPANLRAFLRQTVPALADSFDCSRRRLLDREFPLDDWRRREADLPFEVPYRYQFGGQERWALIYVLIEHQSAEDPAMPLRLLYFVVLYWERQWREWVSRPGRRDPLLLSPVLPLVLYTGSRPWENNRTLHDLLDEPSEFHGFVPQWGPLFWELGQHTADDLLASGDEWQQVLAVLRATGEARPAFERVYEEALRRLGPLASQDEARWYDLLRTVLSWSLWRRGPEERTALQAAAVAAQTEAKHQQEVGVMADTIAESIWKEGWTQGRSEGRSEGRFEGSLDAVRLVLQRLLTASFGPLPEDVVQRIGACTDLERLIAAAEQARTLDKLEDLTL
jgi:hypothetical protein